MINPERVQQVKDAIIHHLKTVGPCHWDEVKKDFLDVSHATFWRYVTQAKELLERPVVSSIADDLFSVEEKAPSEPGPSERPKVNTVFRLLNHAQRFYELHSDLLALRQHALDAEGRIRDAQLFAKSIRLRNQLLNDELSVIGGVERADINTQFFDRVIEAIAKASPEVAKAIIISLEALNAEINPPECKDTTSQLH
jgi:hypothetical protein